jgi:hypothetical protein
LSFYKFHQNRQLIELSECFPGREAERTAQIFSNFSVRNMHNVYTAITGSILDILDPEWSRGKIESLKHESIADFLRVHSSILVFFWEVTADKIYSEQVGGRETSRVAS